ncbi:unnamed protein product [Pylaiella littoralis]
MHSNETRRGSSSRGGRAGLKQAGNDHADRTDSECARTRGETRDGSRRRRGRQAPPRAAADAFGRNWRVSAGAAGVLLFSMALTGGLALLSTIRRARAPVVVQMNDEAAVVQADVGLLPSSVRKGRDERRHDTANPRVGVEDTVNKKNTEEHTAEQRGKIAKPNVFFIMIDDMGWSDIGYQSEDLQGTTPNLDKLAAGGVKMSNYYSMAICTPARASLMTGRYVVRYGLQYNVIQPAAPWGLPVTEKIFPEYMRDAGYQTHMIGKWHLGSYTQDLIPSQRGFDTFVGFLNDEETYWSHQSYTSSLFGRKFFDFGFGNATGYYDIIDRSLPDHVQTGFLSSDDGDAGSGMLSPTTTSSSSVSATGNGTFMGKYSTQVFQDRAMDILEQKTPFDEEPLFLYLAHQAVHSPLGLPPEGSLSDEQTALLNEIGSTSDSTGHLRVRFAKVLMYLDNTIGDLVQYLEAEGWMENSIIVVASDNGGCPRHGGSNYPLRGTKYSYWEGGNKVPAFMYSTSHIPEERWGTKYGGIMHVTDWLPTIASGAGIDLHGAAGALDGVDQWDSIVNKETALESQTPRQELLYNLDPYIMWTGDDDSISESPKFPLAQGAFRSGNYKFISNEWCTAWYTFSDRLLAEDPLTNTTTMCDGSSCSHGSECNSDVYHDYLFDLDADPREENNLIEVYPEIAERLRDRWVEVAFSEWTDSLHVARQKRAYYVWMKYNWWMVPWWSLAEGATEDPFGINSTSSSTSDSGSNSSSSSTSSSSLSSTVSS